MDRFFKSEILKALTKYLNAYGKMPKEIRNQINFDQIPIDVYETIKDYYKLERELPVLRSARNKIDEYFLGGLGFVELIKTENFNKSNTLQLYNWMLEEIRNLPDIKNSNDVIKDYDLFEKTLRRKDSPSKDLFLVLPSRFLNEYYHYQNLYKN